MRLSVIKKLLVFFLLIAVFFYSYFSFSFGEKKISRVILISIDTCRADYLSCYGYPLGTTPNIDALANQGILFENAISPVPLTLPSHSSIMTGTIPPLHGVHDNKGYQLGASSVTLSEVVKEKGFATGGIVSAFVLDSKFGLDQGFDTYNDEFDQVQDSRSISERIGMDTSDAANEWLEKHCDDDFFLFLHYYDPHFPYQSPEPFASQFKVLSSTNDTLSFMDRDMHGNYAGEIAYVDHCIGQVVDKLKKLKLYDSTLIIITSDHGEMLREHSETSHGYFIYQSSIKIPLIFKLPWKTEASRIRQTVGLVDIFPTVCGMLGIEQPENVQGIDLEPYLLGKSSPEKRAFYCESFLSTMYGASPLWGIVTDGWKYIQAPRPELYDLSDDQKELYNLASEQKNRSRLLQDKLKNILEKTVPEKTVDNKLVLDKESKARLESLGYLASSMVVESFEFDQTKKDPKDLVELHSLYSNLNIAFSKRQYQLVKFLCEKIEQVDPTFLASYYFLGTIAYEEKEYEKVIEYFSRYLEYDANNHEIFNNIGLAYFHLNNHVEAVRNFEIAMTLAPESGGVYYNLGREFFRIGDFDKATSHFQRAIDLDPEDDKAKHELNRSLMAKQETEKALKHFHNMLQKKPDSPVAHFNLADIYLRLGKKDLAFQHCSKALKAETIPTGMRLSIVSILLKLDKTQLGLAELDRIVQDDSDSIDRLNSLAWFQAASTIEGIRNPQQAIINALKACEISEYRNPETLDTLAVAYAAVGDYQQAIETAQKAIDIANTNDEDALADRIQNRLKLYKNGKPYIDDQL